jgi:oxygen-dependent protoporphyrinogen oxidase
MTRVAVIGGGISGLSAAFRLRELDPCIDVKVFEGAERIGGVLQTVARDGFLIEQAADGFQSQLPWGVNLCRRLGLDDELIGTAEQRRGVLVLRNGRLERIPEGFTLLSPARLWPMARTPLLSARGKLRLLMEAIVPPRREPDDESIADFAVRRLGRETYERIVQPLVTCIYGADPAELSLHALLSRFSEMERTYGSLMRGMRKAQGQQGRESCGTKPAGYVTLRGGMASLPEAIARRLPPGSVQPSSPIHWLAPTFDGGWRLWIGGENPRAVDADAVILATPAHRAARLLGEVDESLSQRLSNIEYTSTAVVSLAYRREHVKHPLDAYGLVVPLVEGRCVLSCSFSSEKYPDRAPDAHVLLRVVIGGACHSGLLRLPDDLLGDLGECEAASLLGIEAAPLFRDVVRHIAAVPQYRLGHQTLVQEIFTALERWPGLALAGNAYNGVGVPQCIQSGEQAAEQIAAQLTRQSITRPPLSAASGPAQPDRTESSGGSEPLHSGCNTLSPLDRDYRTRVYANTDLSPAAVGIAVANSSAQPLGRFTSRPANHERRVS